MIALSFCCAPSLPREPCPCFAQPVLDAAGETGEVPYLSPPLCHKPAAPQFPTAAQAGAGQRHCWNRQSGGWGWWAQSQNHRAINWVWWQRWTEQGREEVPGAAWLGQCRIRKSGGRDFWGGGAGAPTPGKRECKALGSSCPVAPASCLGHVWN